MFRFLHWLRRPLTVEERQHGVEVASARVERFGRLAEHEEVVLEVQNDLGLLRRLWRRCKLYLYRSAEKRSRGDIARLGGPQR